MVSEKLDWFVLRVSINRESTVRREVLKNISRDKVEEIFIPTYERSKKSGSGRSSIAKPLSGYIFLKMQYSDEIAKRIESIRHTHGFIGAPAQPVKDIEIERLKNLSEKSIFRAEIGSHVMVTDGPFKDFTGIIASLHPEKNTCMVDLHILGRSTPVELGFSQFEVEES